MEKNIAIVTGAAGGIGRDVCLSLLSDSYIVCGLDLSEKGLHADTDAAVSLSNYHHYPLDITDDGNVRRVVERIGERFGRIDVLINNAGWDKFMLFEKTEKCDWEKVTAINLLGPLSMTHSALPYMKQRGGAILNVASDAGRIGSSGEAVYSACKAGMIGFSKSLAREMARFNIRVNVVCPGPTETALLDQVLEGTGNVEKASAAFLKTIPMRRFGKPGDISAAICFLISEKASYVTGQVLSVSGGLTMVD